MSPQRPKLRVLLPLAAVLLAALPSGQGYELIQRAITGSDPARHAAARRLAESGERAFVSALVDALFFLHADEREPLLGALRKLTGEDPGPRYQDWVELVGRRSDLQPAAGYLAWKGALFARIDPRYRTLLAAGAPVRIRPEEIVWGGVKLDGIPSLDDPPYIAAAAARDPGDLDDGERVFGVSLGGARRAYPLRYLSWHEMLNDSVGGVPLTLSYCSLCGSGIAFSAKAPDGGRRTFGTSGLLYRSNKLMVDRETSTLWIQMTGEAVLGPLAKSQARLDLLPMTLTTWGEWRALHPDTSVLHLDARFGARWGYRYTPGAADLARSGVSFPLWKKSRLLPDSEEVYGLALGEHAKAWPVTKADAQKVINDRVGDTGVVLVAHPESGAVRAYARAGHTFQPADAATLKDEAGRRWRVTEEALESEGAAPLPRLPGHVALWFAWYGFHPQTEVWNLR